MSNKNPKIEVTLLSKKEVKRKSKVLQKVGRGCEEVYWTSTSSYFSNGCHAYGLFVHSSGELGCNSVSFSYGVRPVLKSDNLEELIKDCKSKIKNGVQIVEYGQFPNLYEETEIDHPYFLRETGKKYSLPSQKMFIENFILESFPEYDYNGKKVIKNYYEKYFPVKPVRFYVDRENSMLISTDALFRSPIDSYHFGYDYTDFKTSQLYRYLNNEFIKDLRPDKQLKTLHDEDSIPDFMTQRANQEDIDETKKSLIERIDKLLKRNAELQAISKAMANELKELRADIKGKKYVRK